MNVTEYKTTILERFSGSVEILENVPTKKVTTFGLGSPIPLLLEPSNISVLRELLCFLKEANVRWYMLGAGSNTVFPDAPLQKVIIRLGRAFDKTYFYSALPELSPQNFARFGESDEIFGDFSKELDASLPLGEHVYALTFARTSLINLSSQVSSKGFSGLEYGGGIPASVGGAVLIHAGAHGWAIGSVVEAVWILNNDGQLLRIGKDELEFSYRHSNLPVDGIVLATLLRLTRQDVTEVMAKRQHGLDYRKKNQPITMPSSGSIFRNPSGSTIVNTIASEPTALPPAGKLIDDAGLKGFRIGTCEVSSVNANWIVRVAEDGKQEDLLKIMQAVKDKVLEMSGIELCSEVKIVSSY